MPAAALLLRFGALDILDIPDVDPNRTRESYGKVIISGIFFFFNFLILFLIIEIMDFNTPDRDEQSQLTINQEFLDAELQTPLDEVKP